jgi:hypothetical protein
MSSVLIFAIAGLAAAYPLALLGDYVMTQLRSEP